MRIAIAAFVFGVALLQRQANLESEVTSFLAISLATLVYTLICLLWEISYLRYIRLVCFALIFSVIGFFWANLRADWLLQENLPVAWEQREMRITGVVESLPHYTEQGVRFNFNVEQLAASQERPIWFPSHVTLTWKIQSEAALQNSDTLDSYPIKPGQRWRLTVRLKRPHGNANPLGFDYEVWLLEQGIRATGAVRSNQLAHNSLVSKFVWTPSNLVNRWRDQLRQRIHRALPTSPYAGVLVALVIGDQREIAQSDWAIFNRTGIGHLISISGLHITMVSGMFAGLMSYFWRRSFFTQMHLPLHLPAQKVAALSAVLMALLYVALSGFGIPAQRTLLMISIVALAVWSGRMVGLSHVLCLALGAVVLFDPWAVLWPGFWLSFAAVAVILYVSMGRAEGSFGDSIFDRLQKTLMQAWHVQYAITIGLVPLSLLLFAQLSLISPLANALAIPLVSFVIAPLALIACVLPAPLSTWLWQFSHWFVVQLAAGLQLFSTQTFAVKTFVSPSIGIFFLALIGTLWMLAPRGWPWRFLGWFCWLPLILQKPEMPNLGQLNVTVFDVGQGMAVLLETASHRMLYDAGPYYSPVSDAGSRVILPYLNARGITHLDKMLISHNDNDHSGGALSLLQGLSVQQLMSSLKLDSPIISAAKSHQRCLAGQSWQWDGVAFEMLQPVVASYESEKWRPNARSCTLKISTKRFSLLLPGDIEATQEDELLHAIPEKLSATVLLAPHHGSGTSSTPAFLRAVQPQLALFQVGYHNRYRHPKPQVFQRYAEFGIKRLRTDESGAIRLQFGDTLAVSAYRKEHARYWYAH
jgi:competence protein ComEC